MRKDTRPETIDTRHGKYRVLELRQRTEHRGPWTHLTNNILDTDSEEKKKTTERNNGQEFLC